jgi:hypothetical protein
LAVGRHWRGSLRRDTLLGGRRRSRTVRRQLIAILARESTGAQGIGFDTAVVGTQTGDHFSRGLHEQEKADAKENTDGRARDEPDEDKVE